MKTDINTTVAKIEPFQSILETKEPSYCKRLVISSLLLIFNIKIYTDDVQLHSKALEN